MPETGPGCLAPGSEQETPGPGEQQSVGLAAKLEEENERAGTAEAAPIAAAAQGHKQIEAGFLEVAKVETAKNTIADLAGKLDFMQGQIGQQAPGRPLPGKRTRGR